MVSICYNGDRRTQKQSRVEWNTVRVELAENLMSELESAVECVRIWPTNYWTLDAPKLR